MLSSRVVAVQVGRDKVKWSLHENLISETCDFFKVAFRGEFKEKAGELELPDDDPAAFELFIRWLYAKRASLATSSPFLPINGPADVRQYLQLYVLAAKYLIGDLQNEVIDIVYDYFAPEGEPYPDLRDVQFLFENTGSNDAMRKLLTVHASFELFSAQVAEGKEFPDHWDEVLQMSADVGYEIIRTISTFGWKMEDCPKRTVKDRCHFHSHEDSEKCVK